MRRTKAGFRDGTAAVEFAMTTPLVLLVLFGALELSHANMVFNSTEAAAHEGARQGILPGASSADCVAAAERLLAISGIQGAAITVTPTNLNTDSKSVIVKIDVPYSANTIITPTFTQALQISRQCELDRESL